MLRVRVRSVRVLRVRVLRIGITRGSVTDLVRTPEKGGDIFRRTGGSGSQIKNWSVWSLETVLDGECFQGFVLRLASKKGRCST